MLYRVRFNKRQVQLETAGLITTLWLARLLLTTLFVFDARVVLAELV